MSEIATAEAMVRALWLVRNDLVDVGTRELAEASVLAMRLLALGFPDERVARRTAQDLLKDPPTLMDNLDRLNETLFQPCQGLPVMRENLVFRRLCRLIDADGLVCLYRELNLPGDERFDWGAVPMADAGKIDGILWDASLDTHIHLGGALPPLFYWVALMGGELPLETLAAFPRPERGHAKALDWQQATVRAMKLRLALAGHAQRKARLFGHLPELLGPAEFKNRSPAGVREYLLQLSWPWRRYRSWQSRNWTFADPLRSDGVVNYRCHYAEGERRLLCFLGNYLRGSSSIERAQRQQVEQELLDYLRIRNAFHQLLIHDDGSDGLMRFVETFGRRGSLLSIRHLRGQQGSPFRQRRRKMALSLERTRMTAALNSQLLTPFDASSHQHGASRRIEMRVSVPSGNYLVPTLRAWLIGIHDHLCGYNRRDRATTEKVEPKRDCVNPACRSQVGLLFHLIKGGKQAGKRADEDARRLGDLLRDYPRLRPFIIGLDVAGDERGTAPRVYGAAYQRLRDLQAKHRARPGDPTIRLGWTYHVGEDVEDLLTGLRHLDEVTSLLFGPEGGRLGHALVLGEDPARFYRNRGGETEPPLGSHLLDLVWAWGTLGDTHRGDHGQWLENRISRLGFPSAEDRDPDLKGCYRAMGLGDNGSRQGAMSTEEDLLGELGFHGKPESPVLLRADEAWLELLHLLQALLIKRLAYRRICIEANPTSNLIIGGYSDYRELPYPRMVAEGLALSLNTDDPGLFVTCLPAEYSAMYHVLIQEMPHRQALQWLADRRFDAEQSTFLGPRLPMGQDALPALQNLDRLFDYRTDG